MLEPLAVDEVMPSLKGLALAFPLRGRCHRQVTDEVSPTPYRLSFYITFYLLLSFLKKVTKEEN